MSNIQNVLSNRELPLHVVVKELIHAEGIYEFFKQNPEQKQLLLERTQEVIDGFNEGTESYKYILHRTLNYIYETNLFTPDKKPVHNQFDPTLIEVQKELEFAWEAFEESRMPSMESLEIPEDPKEFERWLRHFILNHPVADHPIYTYLENEATFAEMRDFISQEITVDTRFDDLVAFTQIGTDGTIKMELAENYWDEMGNGKLEEVHTVMFNHLMVELNLTDEATLQDLMEGASWESLAGGNALLYTAMYRKNIYKALGALGALEMMSPKRFSRLVAGYQRLGLSELAQKYHDLHVAIDTRHGNGWLRNAVVPFVEADPKNRYEIVKGAFFRLHTSLDYVNKLYHRYSNNMVTA
ncbi:MAG: iron-containing redox enzyme family protein [Tumebacillaceae bacterium]